MIDHWTFIGLIPIILIGVIIYQLYIGVTEKTKYQKKPSLKNDLENKIDELEFKLKKLDKELKRDDTKK